MITVKIPVATPSLNETNRWQRRERWKIKSHRETMRDAVWAELIRVGMWPIPAPDRRVDIRITRYSAGELDDDNYRGGAKYLMDALTELSLIRDDSPEWVHVAYKQRKCPKGEGHTVVEIDRGKLE